MSDEQNPDQSQENNLPVRNNPGDFGRQSQPSGAAKSLGWWKKRQGRKMIKALLQLKFEGDVPDPANPGKLIPNPIKRQAANYFGVPQELITVEMIMAMRQVGLAVQKGDTQAFDAVWNKAYGKPPANEIEDGEDVKPIINITIGKGTEDLPEISEDENDIETEHISTGE